MKSAAHDAIKPTSIAGTGHATTPVPPPRVAWEARTKTRPPKATGTAAMMDAANDIAKLSDAIMATTCRPRMPAA